MFDVCFSFRVRARMAIGKIELTIKMTNDMRIDTPLKLNDEMLSALSDFNC